MNYKDYFKDKKITVMGLGLLGRGVGDIAFLAEAGADLIVTDLKNKEELSESLEKLKKYQNIKYTLGEHKLEDFKDRDMILKSAGVPLDSPYIQEARKNNISIEMSTALFVKLSETYTIGVTGTRGKSTVTHLLYEILKEGGIPIHLGLDRSQKRTVGQETLQNKVFLGGNIRGVSTLAQLDCVKKGDTIVLELDSWQLQGFGEAKISPNIAIFTNLMSDHINYYKGDIDQYLKDKENIFIYQKGSDILITGKEVAEVVRENAEKHHVSPHVADSDTIPSDWKIQIRGEHNRDNIALAVNAARRMNVPESTIRKVVESFKGVSGRLEFIREVGKVKIYNDTTATTPEATLVALKALGENKNIILIMGGSDKMLDMSKLVATLDNYCKSVLLLSGTGTDKLDLKKITTEIINVDSLKSAVDTAMKKAVSGDIVLLSPSFASFGMFANEFDRGEQFVELVNRL